MQEAVASIGYQVDLPKSEVVFKGKISMCTEFVQTHTVATNCDLDLSSLHTEYWTSLVLLTHVPVGGGKNFQKYYRKI